MLNSELESQAKEQLQSFISETFSLFKQLVYDGFDLDQEPFFLENHLEQIKAAWKEFHEDFDTKNAKQKIMEASGRMLQIHGLYGKQLELKLSVINTWRERFNGNRAKKILIKLLDAIDTLLDSLIKATGIDEALKEIKDILRNSIDEH